MLASSLQWRQRLWRVFVCTMLMALPLTAAAQNITGQITGRVTDSSGGTLPGVSVTVVNENTGLSVTRVTDATGVYVFTNLPVGSYSVAAELEGFRKVQRTGFQLGADGRVSADFSLTVGGLQESVEVTAVMGETVNRTSGEVARTIDSQQIKDLAFNGRNYLELASLIPGAVATDYDPLALATSLSVTGQSINGNRGNTNNLTVDGGSNLDSGSNGSQVNNVSLTFIDQVKIQTSNFSAELGRNSGAAINVVTRSGTNRFSGSGRYDLRDEAFDEPNYFAARDAAGNRTKPELEFRNIEAGIGGPIVKNKLFFFGGQQYRTINRFTSPGAADDADECRAERRLRVPPARHRRDCRHRRRRRAARSGVEHAVSRQPHSGQSDYDRRPRHRQHLRPDDRARVGVHGLDHCQQRDLPALQPVRTAAGHHPHRLAGDRQAAHLRPLPARRVRPARSLRRLLQRAAADGADQPVASRHELPRRPHLRAQFQPDQRSEGHGGVERAAHQPAGRHLAAGHLRLPVPRALPRRVHHRRHPDGKGRRFSKPHQPVVRAAVADDRHHLPEHADLHARPALGAFGLCGFAQPQGPERPCRVSGRRYLQHFGQSEQHEQRAGRRAARQFPLLQRGLGRSGRVLPVHRLPGLRLRFVAGQAEPEPGARPPLRVRAANLRPGQQPGELRPGSLRSVAGGHRADRAACWCRTPAIASTA